MRIWFSNKQTSRQEGECDFMEAALTALFDGEATPEEASKARNHLITCARCAELWAGWNQTRYLFQQAPIAAPPKLLLRILLACRLASAREASEATARHKVPRRLAPARDVFEPAPPLRLHSDILKLTTGARPAATPHSSSHSRRRGLSLGLRYGAATAVPAMLLIFSMTASTPLESSLHGISSAGMAGVLTASVGSKAESGRRHLASVVRKMVHLQPLAADTADAIASGDDAAPLATETQTTEAEHRFAMRRTNQDFERPENRREPREPSQPEREAAPAPNRPAEGAPAVSAPRVAHQVNRAPAGNSGVQFASISLPQNSRFEREVAALPPVASVTQTVTRIAPTAMMLVRRMASTPVARPIRARATLTPIHMAVAPQLASFRSAGLSTLRRDSISAGRRSDPDSVTASDSGDSSPSDSDLRDNRPDSVKNVIDTFRAALDQDDSDPVPSDG